MARKTVFKDWVLHEDDDYIVVNKPSGISSLKERGNEESTNLLELARAYDPNAFLCHRLDKLTSGIMLIAKSDGALRHASMQFQNREVKKTYHAIVQGVIPFETKIVDLPIHVDERKRKVKIDKNIGKKSITHFKKLKIYRAYSLVECKLETGRMHQIRIHLSHLGYPIIGDHLYGGNDLFLSDIKHKFNYNRTGEEQPLIHRFPLHALDLEFRHLDGNWMSFTAPYPKDILVLIKQLEKYNSVE